MPNRRPLPYFLGLAVLSAAAATLVWTRITPDYTIVYIERSGWSAATATCIVAVVAWVTAAVIAAVRRDRTDALLISLGVVQAVACLVCAVRLDGEDFPLGYQTSLRLGVWLFGAVGISAIAAGIADILLARRRSLVEPLR